MDSVSMVCAVCGQTLPNRYAVAGRCESLGCGAVFCALHWHGGNRLCPAHGWCAEKSQGGETEAERKMNDGSIAPQEASKMNEGLDVSAGKGGWFKSLMDGAQTLGKASVALVNRLRGIRDPEAAIAELDGQLAATRAKREPLSARYEELYLSIADRKKLWRSAPPARKKMLEMELKTLLAEYKSVEGQLSTLFEHERLIVTVRGRTLELAAQGLSLPKVEDVDRLTDDIENAVDETEDLSDAVADLDKAGVRRERTSVDLEDALAEFGDAETETATRKEPPGMETA